MLSIEQCRKIDSDLSLLSDDEVTEVISNLYELGQVIFDDWLENNGSKYPIRVLQKLDESNKLKVWNKQD